MTPCAVCQVKNPSLISVFYTNNYAYFRCRLYYIPPTLAHSKRFYSKQRQEQQERKKERKKERILLRVKLHNLSSKTQIYTSGTMIHANSESDVTSLAPSSPISPKRAPAYYVLSPSHDSTSHDDGDKSVHATATTASSSPSHSSNLASASASTTASRASRISGAFRPLRMSWKRSGKGWPERNVIEEEGYFDDDDDVYDDGRFARRRQCLVGVLGFVSVFFVFCLIIWGSSRPFRPWVAVQSFTVSNLYFGQGSDHTGVPTKLLTVNCSVQMVIHNPATYFGIHVSSSGFNLFYSEITVATGQLKKYYQPRKSQRIVSVNLGGKNVPLYGAGSSLAAPEGSGGVTFKLEFDIRSRGDVVGKLVKTKHRRHISCSLGFNSSTTKAIKFKDDSCTYD